MAETQAETPVELPPRPGPVNHPSLKDTAAAYLREQILTGRLTPGTKVDQDEISEALGMSRLPVREALIELRAGEPHRRGPRRGAFVARLERADIVDHYRIFGLIAGLAGSRAATSLSDEELVTPAPHPRVVRRRDRPGGQGPLEPRVPQDDQPGRRLAAVGRRCSGCCRAASRCATSSSPRNVGRRSRPAITHGSCTALEAHDAYEAQRMLEHHVAESGDLAVEILQEMGYWERDTGDAVEASESGAA